MAASRGLSVTQAEFERAYGELQKPVLTAKDVADFLGVSVTTATNHLQRLARDGEIHSTKVSNARAYFPNDTVIVQTRQAPLTYGGPIPQ